VLVYDGVCFHVVSSTGVSALDFIVAFSITEAKYMALIEATKESI